MAGQEVGPAGLTASVVVLTHNRREPLEACLRAIVGKTGPGYELLVVDNGSTDGSREWAEHFLWSEAGDAGVQGRLLALEQNEGVCARNHALRVARGQYILQVDDDVIVGPGWDTSLLGWFCDEHVGAAGQEGFWLNWQGFMAPGRTLFLDRRRPAIGDFADLVMGYCWAWRNDRLEGAPGTGAAWDGRPYEAPRFLYDDRFNPHWHEETDLQLQIKAAGYRIRCGPVVAKHRSLKSWQAAHHGDPMVGLQHAVDHEHLLLHKWEGRRESLGLELDRRGTQ